MGSNRSVFTPDVKKILFTILPDHVTPSGSKIAWHIVAATLNKRCGKDFEEIPIKNWFMYEKKKHQAWNELKKWTGIGWKENGYPDVDATSEKWQAFIKRYPSAKTLRNHPLEFEEEWDKILLSGYATGDRSYTPSTIPRIQKEVVTVEEEGEESADSDDLCEVTTQNNDIAAIRPKKRKSIDNISQLSKKSTREEDINTCLNQMKKSFVSQSSKPLNPFDEVQNKLESMGIVQKYGDEFVVDVLDSFRKTAGAIDLFNSLRSDVGRLHFLKKHCSLEDDVYRPLMPMDVDDLFSG